MEQKDVLLEALQQPWQVQEKAMETDVSALQWVEDLEQRVIAADLHLKVKAELNRVSPFFSFLFFFFKQMIKCPICVYVFGFFFFSFLFF